MRKQQNNFRSPAQVKAITEHLVATGREYKRIHGNNAINRSEQFERKNEIGKCRAQTLYKIQVLAANLGRTPRNEELVAIGLDSPHLSKMFGSLGAAIVASGLERNLPLRKQAKPLPEGFPTKEQLVETRMPWPKEYFGVRNPHSSSAYGAMEAGEKT